MDSNLRVAWGSKAKLAKNCVFSWSRAKYFRRGQKGRMQGENELHVHCSEFCLCLNEANVGKLSSSRSHRNLLCSLVGAWVITKQDKICCSIK